MHLRSLTVIAAICLGLCSVHAHIPKQITYQGVLKDASGVKITGTVDLTFNIYPLGGGDSLYTETHTGVSVGNGLFRVQIGAVTPLTLAFDAPYELGVTADDDAEMIPHTPLSSAPYALNASGVHIDGGNAGDVLTNDGNGTGVWGAPGAGPQGAMFSALFSVSGGTSYASIAYSHQGTNQGGQPSDNSFAKTLIPRDGEISNLFIRPAEFLREGYLSYELPADAHVTFTIRVNDTDTALSVTHIAAVNGLAPVGNTTDRVMVNQGDMVTLKAEGNASTRYWLSLEIK